MDDFDEIFHSFDNISMLKSINKNMRGNLAVTPKAFQKDIE